MIYTHRKSNVVDFLIHDYPSQHDDIEFDSMSALQLSARKSPIVKACDAFEEICMSLCAPPEQGLKPEGNSNLRKDSCHDHELQTCYNEEEYDGQFEDLLPEKELKSALQGLCTKMKDDKSNLPSVHRVSISLDASVVHDSTRHAHPQDISFQWFARRNWFHSCLQHDSVELHKLPEGLHIKPCSYHMLTRDVEWKAVPNTYMLFIDGSATQKGAAWSVVLVATDGWTQTFAGCAYGSVLTNQKHEAWVGATEEDNIAAEFTALLYALNWVFKCREIANFIILPDLMLSKMMAEQSVLCKAHPVLARMVRVYADWVEHKCSYVHVKAHDQHAWNELVDSIANFAAVHALDSQESAIMDLHELAQNNDDTKWIWMQDSTESLAHCFPPMVDEQAAILTPCMRKVDTPTDSCKDQSLQHRLKIKTITANVLAMDTKTECDTHGRANSARTARLDSQWDNASIAIAGLQETRTEAGRFMSENFHIFASGADFSHTAALGCEIWLHKSLPFAFGPNGEKVTFSNANIVVQHATARQLFLRVESQGYEVSIVSLHAPCIKTDNFDQVRTWWEDTADLLRRYANSQFIICLIDANAPLASHESEQIGLEGAESMNAAGELFEHFIYSLNLFAPSTMSWCHEGQSTTWSHPKGTKRRRDYVLISEQMMPMVVGSHVVTNHDTTFGHEDHLPVLLNLEGVIEIQSGPAKIKWDYDKMKDPTICSNFRAALASLPIPDWSVQVDDHCRLYETQLLQLGRQFFELTKKKKNRPQLSASTLEAIQVKRSCLDYGRRSGEINDPDFRHELKLLESDVKKLVWHDIRLFYENLLQEIEDASQLSDFKVVYKTLTRFGSKKAKGAANGRPLPLLTKTDGTPAQSFEQQQQTWQQQFAKIEAGELIAWENLKDLNHKGLGLQPGTHDPALFPDEMQIGLTIAKLKRGKTPGPNQIPNDLLKAGSTVVAKHMSIMMSKVVAHGKEPMQWKGGYLVPLYKRGPPSDPHSYRSIFLSDVTAKLFHSWIRSHILQSWETGLTNLQYGGRPKCGTDTAHIWLQIHDQWSQFHGLPTAKVFFDLRSAFYMVLRQVLVTLPDEEASIYLALTRLGIEPQQVASMIADASKDQALSSLTLHAQAIVRDLMSNTHFWVKGLEHPTKTNRGTRPGDPVADLLFNVCMSVILRDTTEGVQSRTDAHWLGSATSCKDFMTSQPVPCPAFLDISYVDDCVFLLHAQSNEEIEDMACIVVEEMTKAAAKRGLLVNFEKGKTEMLWTVRGKGSRKVRESLHDNQNVIQWNDAGHDRELRVVQAYKHLGTWVQSAGKHGKELQSRAANALASWGPLTRGFYCQKRVSIQSKAKVLGTLTYSRLLYNAHTWAGITDSQIEKWQNAVRKPLASMVKSKLLGLAPFQFSVDTLAGLAGILTPMDSLHIARLRFLRRFFDRCPQILWNLVWDSRMVEHSWIQHCLDSLSWLQMYCPSRLPFSEKVSFCDWISPIMLDSRWNAKIKAAARSCKAYRREYALQHVWEVRLAENLISRGVQLKCEEDETESLTWQCAQCPERFKSKTALAMHSHKCHGYKTKVRFFAGGKHVKHACTHITAVLDSEHTCAIVMHVYSNLKPRCLPFLMK